MAYPQPFIRVTAEGTLNVTEAFSFGLNIVRGPTFQTPLGPVTQETADAVGVIVANWFGGQTTPTPGITNRASLTVVKVNRIGTDGHYMDAESREYAVVPPRPGQSGATTTQVPPQNALVVSLIGNENPRALAGRGRFYLPPVQGMGEVSANGLLSNTDRDRVANAAQDLIQRINALWNSLGVGYAYVGNTSPGGSGRAGRQQVVSQIRVGNVVDTVRSRRRSLQEAYADRTIA